MTAVTEDADAQRPEARVRRSRPPQPYRARRATAEQVAAAGGHCDGCGATAEPGQAIASSQENRVYCDANCRKRAKDRRKRKRLGHVERRRWDLLENHDLHERMAKARVAGSPCPKPDKARYLDAREALEVLDRMRGQHLESSSHLNAYPCDCGHFHIGNLDESRWQA